MVGRSKCVSPGLWIPDCCPVIRISVPETSAITCVRDDRYHPPPAASGAHEDGNGVRLRQARQQYYANSDPGGRNKGKWCGREDSNFHGLAATTTSTLRVYQFRHDRTQARMFGLHPGSAFTA
jgi:hypothetical protein